MRNQAFSHTDTPTVFIVDDDADLRATLCMMAESVGLRVVEYGDASAYLQDYDPARPGCLVLDLRMPGRSGLHLQEELVRRGSPPPIIFLSGHGSIPAAMKAAKAGAVHFFEKPFDAQDLLDCIQQSIADDARERAGRTALEQVRARLTTLTARERQVLDLVVAGHASKVIAADLGISEKTVENHRHHIMEKMGAGSVVDLVRAVLSVS